jgi:hypothetical protein
MPWFARVLVLLLLKDAQEAIIMKRITRLFIAAIIACALSAPLLHAAINPARTTYITFSRPVTLPGVSLTAGTYVFELASPSGDQSIVRVSSRDRSRMYLMVFTHIVDRPASLAEGQMIAFGESTTGQPSSVLAWYPDGDATGRQFIYR